MTLGGVKLRKHLPTRLTACQLNTKTHECSVTNSSISFVSKMLILTSKYHSTAVAVVGSHPMVLASAKCGSLFSIWAIPSSVAPLVHPTGTMTASSFQYLPSFYDFYNPRTSTSNAGAYSLTGSPGPTQWTSSVLYDPLMLCNPVLTSSVANMRYTHSHLFCEHTLRKLFPDDF